MRMHTDERPYKCDWPGCEKAFTRSDNCAAHIRLHQKQQQQQQQREANDLALTAPLRRRSSSTQNSLFEPSPISSVRSSPSLPSPILPYTPPLYHQFSTMVMTDEPVSYGGPSPQAYDAHWFYDTTAPPSMLQTDAYAVLPPSPTTAPMQYVSSLDWQPYPSTYMPHAAMSGPFVAYDPSDYLQARDAQ